MINTQYSLRSNGTITRWDGAWGNKQTATGFAAVKTMALMETERPHVIRQAINCCRKGGTVSIPGVYGGLADKIPMGAMMNKGLTIKTGQCHVHRYVPELLDRIRNGEIDPSFVVTHRLGLDMAPDGFETFKHKQDECVKVVLKP